MQNICEIHSSTYLAARAWQWHSFEKTCFLPAMRMVAVEIGLLGEERADRNTLHSV